MPPVRSKLIIERCYAAMNEGNLDVMDEAAAPNYAYHDPGHPQIHRWPEHKAQLSSLRKAIPDLRFDIDEMIGEEDRVAVRWTMRGRCEQQARYHLNVTCELSKKRKTAAASALLQLTS